MRFELNLRKADFSRIQGSYSPELHDIRAILDDVCDAFQNSTASEFIVSGFGQERWPVSIRTDLSIFLEQLPDAMAALKRREPFLIDFYEQGIERTIQFDPRDSMYTARCESRTKWVPNPAIEHISQSKLEEMLHCIRDEFLKNLTESAPSIAAHPWVSDFFKE